MAMFSVFFVDHCPLVAKQKFAHTIEVSTCATTVTHSIGECANIHSVIHVFLLGGI